MLLNCHTYFSLRYGTFSEEELLKQAQIYEYDKVALTDINNTSACLNFMRLAPQFGIKPILGIDFRQNNKILYVAIARNNQGFQEINSFLSSHNHRKKPLPDMAPSFQNAYCIYPLERILELNKTEFLEQEYVGVRWQELNKLRFSGYAHLQDKIVALQSVTFRNKRDFNIHRILRAIEHNVLLSKLPIDEQADPQDIFLSKKELDDKFKSFPEIIRLTEKLMQECDTQFDFSQNRPHQNKKQFGISPQADKQKLYDLCQEGLKYRYSEVTDIITQRLQKELQIIEQMDFVPFFLINWDIIRYAKQNNYFHVGRGSGANSIVAYLLGITDVDPIDLDLYFERFMNLYRTSPPDFDLDFSWRDRDDVTRYIFDTYGKEGEVALIATYNTFKHSGAIREIGKVFGLPKHEIDVLSHGKYDYCSLDELSQLAHRYAEYMYGMPNHLSVHAGGVLISEKPIHYYCATDLPPKGFPTTQFDMVVAEDVGLFKYDILGQRGLSKIKEAIEIVQKNKPDAPQVDIHHVKQFKEDKNINHMVSKAQCIGCFYVESPAMRMLLRKLQVDNYLGLVAASSIIRPGVAQSGMMNEYIYRHKNPSRRQKAHPVMLELMPETYGVMVYQEDVIKVAHFFAGLDLGQADVLRRAMSGKFRSRDEFQNIKDVFFKNCENKGYDSKLTLEIWLQIESFAGYAFAKGHSASYAIESYQSLYLKCYFPLEYMVAVLNNGGGFYSSEIYIHEARMQGATIHAPCVNHSKFETTIQGQDIYLGFSFLQGLENRVALRIVKVREYSGAYTSFDDFVQRVPISIEQLDILIRIDAFRFTQIPKRNLLWEALLKIEKKTKPILQGALFKPTWQEYKLPEFHNKKLENTFDEIELMGFPLCSPFEIVENFDCKFMTTKNLRNMFNDLVEVFGYLVTVKTTKTKDGKRMNFGTFLDIEGQWIDTVHFPPIVQKFPFRGRGVYKIWGKVVEEFGFVSIEVLSMEKLPYIQDPRYRVLEHYT